MKRDRPGKDADSRSTKQLVARYEAISTTAPRLNGVIHRSIKGISQPYMTTKDIGPLKESFRNLFSIFKKGKRDKEELLPSSTSHTNLHNAKEDVLSDVQPTERISPPSHKRNSGKYSGPVLYLSAKDCSPDILPVWVSCKATLENSVMLISWTTAHGLSSTDVLPLTQMSTVRSLALYDMDAKERAMLPASQSVREFKIFEILCEERQGEKFATSSDQDRTNWIGAIRSESFT